MAQIMAKKCDFSCNEEATLYCKVCNQFLCTECRKTVHDKFPNFKNHAVVNIHQKGICVFRPQPVCESHKNQFLYYCSKCECLTCAECMTSNHNEHKTEKIKNVADARRHNVNQIIEQLKTKVETIKQKLETIDTEFSAQIKSDCESYVEMLEETVDEILKIVDRHKLIPLTTASDFKNIENEDLGRKRTFFKNRQDDIVDRLLKFENLMQETHDSTFLTKWKAHQTDVQMNDEETDDPLVAPRRIEIFNQKKLTKSIIEVIDEKFQIGLKEQEMALTKMTEEFGELRAEVEIKQRTINEVTKEAADNIKKITTEFEDKIKLLEAMLMTSEEDNYKAVKVQENLKKQLSEATDQYNREREKNTKLQTVILKQEQDSKATARNNKDMVFQDSDLYKTRTETLPSSSIPLSSYSTPKHNSSRYFDPRTKHSLPQSGSLLTTGIYCDGHFIDCDVDRSLVGSYTLLRKSGKGIYGVPKEVCCKEYGKAVEDFSRRWLQNLFKGNSFY